jgi:hypothetical protein
MSLGQSPQARMLQKLVDTRDLLMAEGFYIGDSTFRHDVVWLRVGKADHLVVKSDATAYDDAMKEFALDMSATAAPSPPQPVPLSAIVHIPEGDFWFASCAMWKGPTQAAPTFADIKPSFTGQAPMHDPIRADFTEVIANIKWLMGEAATPGVQMKQGLIVNTIGTGAPKLKVKHVVFEVRSDFIP